MTRLLCIELNRNYIYTDLLKRNSNYKLRKLCDMENSNRYNYLHVINILNLYDDIMRWLRTTRITVSRKFPFSVGSISTLAIGFNFLRASTLVYVAFPYQVMCTLHLINCIWSNQTLNQIFTKKFKIFSFHSQRI